MDGIDELLANARAYAQTFADKQLPAKPARRMVVVTCMDSRINVFDLFGLGDGEAHVLRNAGGSVTDDTIRSLTISQRLLGTREIVLVHHTDCGMTRFTDEQFTGDLERETGARPSWTPGAFGDAATDLRESAAAIRNCPFIPHRDAVTAFLFDVETGLLTRVPV